MTTVAERKLTAEEFLASGDSDGYELVHGVPEELQVGFLSSWLSGEVARQMGNLCAETQAGVVATAEPPVAVWGPHHFRKPDVTFIRRGRLAGGLPTGMLDIVPDLIVEVVSPGDRVVALAEKLKDYRAARVPLVWVIYPEQREAVVHRHGKPAETIDTVLDGEDVLPGFRLDLVALFDSAEKAGG